MPVSFRLKSPAHPAIRIRSHMGRFFSLARYLFSQRTAFLPFKHGTMSGGQPIVVRATHRVKGRVESGGFSSVAEDPASCFAVPAEEKEEEATAELLFQVVKTSGPRSKVERVLSRLAQAGQDKAACSSFDADGHTLTHWAAKRGDASLLQSFLGRGAKVDEASRDSVGMRPLHWACTEGRVACMRLLVDFGADIDARDLHGCTPCVIASQWGQADAAAYLVKVGADVRILDKNHDSALHWASYKGNLEIVGLLHHLGLPVDNADAYGQTPLHLAALCGNLSVAEYLVIDSGKAPRNMLEARDKSGKTPLDLAREKKQAKVARFLASQRPLCEQGVLSFVREKMTLRSCVYWILGGTNPEAMKWPWAIMVFNKIVAQLIYFTYFLGLYGGSTMSIRGSSIVAANVVDVPAVVHAININTQFVVWASFLAAWLCDPGDLDGTMFDGALRRAYDAYYDRLVEGSSIDGGPSPVAALDDQLHKPTLCHSCHIQRPLRAKHCKVRRKCVMAFDHYCPYVGNAVGMYNYRYFFLYCLSFTVAALQFQYVAFKYQARHGRDMMLIAFQCWIVPFIMFGIAMVAYHTQLTHANLTTNEHMNLHRYTYFRHPETGAFKNPFDKGCINNFIDRFFPKPLNSHPLILEIIAKAGLKSSAFNV